ncbi:MAG: hypothetical protein R8M14_00660 [Ghiorsea sp.]
MMQLKRNTDRQPEKKENFSSLDVAYEAEHKLAWYYMNAKPRPCFTLDLLYNILDWYDEIKSGAVTSDVEYIVAASKVKGAFNLGGDLGLFLEYIHKQDR